MTPVRFYANRTNRSRAAETSQPFVSVDLQFGHLWFIQNLLVYCLLYVVCRWLTDRIRRGPARSAAAAPIRVPGHGALVLFAFAVAAAAFVIRIRYPLDMWVPVLGFIQAEPARVAQYTAFFAVGVLAFRHDWLPRLPRDTGHVWLAVGVTLAAVLFVTGRLTRPLSDSSFTVYCPPTELTEQDIAEIEGTDQKD